MALMARGMAVAVVFWLGALGSIAYQSVLFLFGVPFNPYFFLYVAMLSLSTWSIVALGGRLPIDRDSEDGSARTPRCVLVAGYLFINAALFFGLWL